MDRFLAVLLLTASLFAVPASADSITGTTISGSNTISGPTITSTNTGAVTATGTFNRRTTIVGGHSNSIGVSALGAGVTAQILREGGNPDVNSTNDSIVLGSITATNSGTITANGSFSRTRIGSGNSNDATGNSVSVSAAGTSVVLSIVHR